MLLQLLKNLFHRAPQAPLPGGMAQTAAAGENPVPEPAGDPNHQLRAAVDLTPALFAALREATADAGRDLPALRPDARAIVLASCDADYFRHFALPFAQSLARNGGSDAALHLQIVDPDRWVAEEMDALIAETPALDIVWAASAVPAGSPPETARSWYACTRFMTLPALLRRHALPVLVSDLDVLVAGPLAEALERHQGADVVMVRNRAEGPPWMHFVPSPLLVRPTPAGIAFADLAARYMAHFLGRGIAPWGLDRIALAAARLDAESRTPQSRIEIGAAADWPLGPSLDHDPDAVASPAFRQYLPRLRRVFGWTLPGSDLFFPSQLAHSAILLGRPTWEGPMLEACLAYCARRRRAVDIGAHIGFWSRWLAHHFDEVEAFEPQPILQECLRANVAAANLHLHPVALGKRSGTIAGAFDPGNTGMSHVVEGPEGQIPLERLDAYGFADVDFIKLDAEGYELFVLQGALDTLRRNRPLVLVEQTNWNARYALQPDAAVVFLKSLGARVIRRMSKSDFLLGWDSAEAWREPPAPGS